MIQINPPFDGSAPCPMCSQEIRGAYSYIHNMLNRWRAGEAMPEPKFWVKLDDLVRCVDGDAGYADPSKRSPRLTVEMSDHPDVRVHIEAILALISVYQTIGVRPMDHDTARQVSEQIRPMIDRLRETKPSIDVLSDAHFDDARHYGGHENILREQRGYDPVRGDYHYTVAVVTVAEDLRHRVCGTGLKLHEHFKSRMTKDKKFYGKVWCMTCMQNVPIDQFEVRF